MDPPNVLKMDSFKRIQGASLVKGSKKYPIFKGINTVGRNKSATVNIAHLNVSQNQAIIVLVDDTLHFISDMNSSNGTFLHNTKLTPFKLYELTDKVKIMFGDVPAVYCKISNQNTTINLQETLDASQLTQNMTQNFYASNTQLIFNNKDVSDHNYFNAERKNHSLYDIHEEATQVVNKPLQLPKTPNTRNESNTQTQGQEYIIEEVVDDIHDAPTQVFNKEKINLQDEKQSQTYQNSDSSVYSKEFHEARTQEVDFPKDKETSNTASSSSQIINVQEAKNSSESTTQVLTTEEKEALVDRINQQNQENISTKVLTIPDVIDRNNKNNLSNTEIIESNEEPITTLSSETQLDDTIKNTVNKNLSLTLFQNKNIIHNSQTPSTSRNLPQTEYDESFINRSVTSKVNDIEETIIDDPDSNDSIDFLNIENAQEDKTIKKLENNQSSKSGDTQVIHKPLSQLSATQLTGKSSQLNRLFPTINSDVDNTQEIGFRKRPPKPLDSQDSDSETDLDNSQEDKAIKNLENTQSSITSDSEVIHRPKKPIPKLPSTQLTGESTHSNRLCPTKNSNNENTQEIGFKKRPSKPLESQDSGSETDLDNTQEDETIKKLENTQSSTSSGTEGINRPRKPVPKLPATINSDTENTQEIGFRKKPSKPLESQDSDSETECEENTVKKINKNKVLNGQFSDSDTDIEDNKNKLDDSDCIPATQDAFAEALGYQSMKSQNTYHSSEESFKLGLTELMDFSQNKDETITEDKNEKNSQSNNSIDRNEKNSNETITKMEEIDKITSQNIQETDNTKKFTFKKKAANLEVSLNTILNIRSDDVYLQPTQKLDSEKLGRQKNCETNDIFFQPTQKVIKFKTDKNDDQNHENEVTTDDVFLQPTQKLDGENLERQKSSKTNDDIFLQPTQKINKKLKQNDIQTVNDGIGNDDIFLQPTQQLDGEHLEKQKIHNDDDIFLQPTQKVIKNKRNQNYIQSQENEDIFLQPTQRLNSENINDKDDPFLQPTQVIDSKKSNTFQNTQDDDVYAASTQIIQEDTAKRTQDIAMIKEGTYDLETQKFEGASTDNTIQTQDENVYDLATQQVDNSFDIQRKKSLGEVDTDTQLEMPFSSQNTDFKISEVSDRPGNPILHELHNFSHQEEASSIIDIPIDISESTSFKKPVTMKTNPNDKINNVESLSQIEAFIKKPLTPTNTRKSVKKSKVDEIQDVPETLSQIEAFVKKPMDNSLIKESNLGTLNSAEEQKTETVSQMSELVDKSLPKINEQVTGRNSERISRGRSSNFRAIDNSRKTMQLEVIREDKNDTLKDDDEDDEFERKDNSRDLKSEGELSFAFLESKTSKIKRKPKNDSVLKEIKVTVTSHRRSMSVGENVKKKEKDIVQPGKRSKRGSSISKLNNQESETTASKPDNSALEVSSKTRKSRIISTSNESENIVPNRTKAGNTFGSDMSTDAPKTRKSQKSSIKINAKKPIPAIEKNKESSKELSINTRTRKRKNESIPQATEENEKVSKNARKSSKKIILDSSDEDSNQIKKEEVFKANTRTSKKICVESSEEDTKKYKEFKQSNSTDDSIDIAKSNSKATKKLTVDLSEHITNKQEFEPPKTSKRITKRQVSDSSESDFVQSGISTPAKRGRISTKNSVPSDDAKSSSKESSVSSDISTPRKGKNAPKTEYLLTTAERIKRKSKPKVVFTMLDSPQLESFIKHLGGSIVDTVDSSTVLVTQSIKRSQKLLTAVAQGKPICSPEWIKSSKKSNDFLDPWDYLLKDAEAEKKWDFSLKESLIRAGNSKLLSNYIFQIMVTNAVDVLKSAIEASGGKIVTKAPPISEMGKFIIISTADQKSKYQKITKKHPDVRIIEPEAIFDGVLRQELRISKHLLP